MSHLLRLMHYVRLSPRVRLGPETVMCLEFATRLRVATIEGRLRAVWSHPANELAGGAKASVRVAIARAIGLLPGSPDYHFIWGPTVSGGEAGGAVLEAKSTTGSLNPGQRDYRTWCEERHVPFFTFRTADEGEAILIDLGVLTR